MRESSFILTWLREIESPEPYNKLLLTTGKYDRAQQGREYPGELFMDTRKRLLYIHQDTRIVLGAAGQDGICIINNMEISDQAIRQLQTRIQQRADQRRGRIDRQLLIPFPALEGAQIDPSSIHIIANDRGVTNRITETIPRDEFLQVAAVANTSLAPGRNARAEFAVDGRQWNVQRTWDGNRIYQVQFTIPRGPQRGVTGWYEVGPMGDAQVFHWQLFRSPASIFWATSPNGRHRYISAFDDEENPPLYFLAQLPDEAEIANYEDAIRSLAPPIVHQAWAEGRRVERHGDIFFIQVATMTEDIEKAGYQIFHRPTTGRARMVRDRFGRFSGVTWQNLSTETQIFGTGHTADRLCITDSGVLVNGTVRHEPWIVPGDEERTADHRPLELPGEHNWYLCVRNTVPAA